MDGKHIKVRIFDTASQERFRTITSSYYDGADGALIVFDLERRSTFEHIDDWTRDLDRYSSSIKKLVVGNKCDKNETRSITDSAALNRCRNLGMSYVSKDAFRGLPYAGVALGIWRLRPRTALVLKRHSC